MRIWRALYEGVYRLIDIIMIVSLVVMAFSVFTNVFFRYFDHAFTWVDEVSRFAFVWLCFSAFVAGTRRMMHPACTMISGRFAGRSGQVYTTVLLLLMFVFAAESFYQAYRRLKYFQQYSQYRRQQVALIYQTEKDLMEKIRRLEGQKTEKITLLEDEKDEQHQLQKEKTNKNKTLAQLKQQEQQLLKQLREQEKARRRLNDEIQRIIAEEIRKAREAGGDRSKAAPSDVFVLTPEEMELS
ncbi:MAG: TRAP transporter small permease subunit, partial [Synergistales bacterium]|nr:TRAP transporter small permease subunit [Synergistales bacterium]